MQKSWKLSTSTKLSPRSVMEKIMITGTSNYDEVPVVPCKICGGYYKADEPEMHVCEEAAQ